MRLLVASLLLLCACNSAPTSSCATPSNAIGAAAEPTSTCNGLCVDGGSAGLFCVVDCTDAGSSVCDPKTKCASGEPLSPKSFCLPTCSGPDAAVTECPSPLSCGDAGVCVP